MHCTQYSYQTLALITVGILTMLGDGGQKILCTGQEIFLFTNVRTVPGAHPAYYSIDPGVPSPAVKRLGLYCDRLPYLVHGYSWVELYLHASIRLHNTHWLHFTFILLHKRRTKSSLWTVHCGWVAL